MYKIWCISHEPLLDETKRLPSLPCHYKETGFDFGAHCSVYKIDMESPDCGVFVVGSENEGLCVCWVICARGSER